VSQWGALATAGLHPPAETGRCAAPLREGARPAWRLRPGAA
jgi:hypothetical protein